MRWDIFCRVVDNYGDIGVCWRLAADLATRGETVRLWVDDPAPLDWMAPDGARGVTVDCWCDSTTWPDAHTLGDVVIEAFGCALPDAVLHTLGQSTPPRVWNNLEYLTAEPYAARSHGLPSPQLAGPAAGAVKHFFYPGFTNDTGGLLRETDLPLRMRDFDPAAWLARHGIDAGHGERVVSLFCYPSAPVGELIDALADAPTVLLVTPDAASEALQRALSTCPLPDTVRVVHLPWLSQRDYDHLLWSCDLNCVRGEDSLVRALWAGKPFLWHIYPQSDNAHDSKLAAFQETLLANASKESAYAIEAAVRHWNGLNDRPLRLPPLALWQSAIADWAQALWRQDDLVTRLQTFARALRR